MSLNTPFHAAGYLLCATYQGKFILVTRTTCVASQIPFPPTTLSLLVLQAMTSMAEVCERYHRITINVVLNSNNFTAYYFTGMA